VVKVKLFLVKAYGNWGIASCILGSRSSSLAGRYPLDREKEEPQIGSGSRLSRGQNPDDPFQLAVRYHTDRPTVSLCLSAPAASSSRFLSPAS
jgi:hypothetical protein